MKKICVITVIVLAVLALVCGVSFADEKPTSGQSGETVTWVYDEATATLTFSGTGPTAPSYASGRPWEVWKNQAKHIVVEEGIDQIQSSFIKGFEKVEDISLPSTLTSIGGSVFEGCKSLKSIVIPEGVTYLSQHAFKDCIALEDIKLPDSLLEVEPYTFEGCTSLRSIVIPDKVKKVRLTWFAGCTSLISITFGESVQSIRHMDQETQYRIRTMIFKGSAPNLEEYTLHRLTVTVYCPAGDSSWNNWPGTEQFDTTIKLVPVNDPSSVVPNLDLNIYSGSCGQTANWELKNGVLKITGTGSVTSSPWDPVAGEVKKIVIEDGITEINCSSAFEPCKNATEVTLSKNLKKLGETAFQGCNIKTLTIPGSLKVIPKNAFSYCHKLEKVVIQEGVISIEDDAFSNCEKLTSVEMPDSLESIGKRVFYRCSAMSSLVIPKNVKFLGEGFFLGMSSLKDIYFMGDRPEHEQTNVYGFQSFTIHIPNYLSSWKGVGGAYGIAPNSAMSVVKYDCTHSCDKWTNADGDKHTAKCSNCGQTVSASHTWTEKSVDKTPTCTEAGSKTMQCKTCGATKVEPIEPTGHAADRSLNYQQNETHHWKDCLVCGAKVDEQEHQGAEECEVCRYKPEPTPTPEPTIAPTPESTPAPESTAKPSATPIPEAGDKGNTPTPDPSQDVGDPKPEKNEMLWIIVAAGVVVAGAAVAVPILLKRKK